LALMPSQKELAGHATGAKAPCAQVEFSGQVVQFALPPVALYVPAAQGLHALPSGPVWPATQLQLVQ